MNIDREIYLRKIIIAVGIILISLLIGVVIYLIIKEQEPTIDTEGDSGVYIGSEWFKNDKVLNITSADYMTSKSIASEYLNAINTSNPSYYSVTQGQIVSEEEMAKIAYNLLSNNYVKDNKITKDNIFTKINKYDTQYDITLFELKKLSNDTDRIKVYATHNLLHDNNSYEVIEEIYLCIYIDNDNNTFSVEPVNVNNIEDISLNNSITEITANDNNRYNYPNISDEDVLNEYINKIKKMSISMPEYVYNNILNPEYKAKRFGTLENFKEYVTNNFEKIKNIKLKKYSKNANNADYIQYTCADQNNNYYIIKERTMMAYEVYLDAYTVDFPEFKNEYNKANSKTKISMNMTKIKQAINVGDYEYVYDKLDTEFKNNNFPTVSSLEEYIKDNMFENNEMVINDVEKNDNTFEFNVTVTDYNSQSNESKQFKFVMQLNDNIDFKISFTK